MANLKPSSSLVYFYYKCSQCGERSDEVSLRQAGLGESLICWHCGNIDKIIPIKDVRAVYDLSPQKPPESTPKQTEVQKPTKPEKAPGERQDRLDAISALQALGFRKGEATRMVESVPLDTYGVDDIIRVSLPKTQSIKA